MTFSITLSATWTSSPCTVTAAAWPHMCWWSFQSCGKDARVTSSRHLGGSEEPAPTAGVRPAPPTRANNQEEPWNADPARDPTSSCPCRDVCSCVALSVISSCGNENRCTWPGWRLRLARRSLCELRRPCPPRWAVRPPPVSRWDVEPDQGSQEAGWSGKQTTMLSLKTDVTRAQCEVREEPRQRHGLNNCEHASGRRVPPRRGARRLPLHSPALRSLQVGPSPHSAQRPQTRHVPHPTQPCSVTHPRGFLLRMDSAGPPPGKSLEGTAAWPVLPSDPHSLREVPHGQEEEESRWGCEPPPALQSEALD